MKNTARKNQQIFDLSIDPDTYKSFEEIVRENDFYHEVHSVTSKDGYILNIFRLASSFEKTL